MQIHVRSLLAVSLTAILLSIASCTSTKEPLSSEEWSRMENVVTSRSFRFDANLAEPIGGRVNRIDIRGNSYFLQMQGNDDLQMALPYFGSRQIAQPGQSQGIQFEGTATDISTNRNEKGNFYNLDFNVRHQSELLQCNLRLYSGMRAVLTINSNQRSSIRYDGEVKPQ